MVFKIWTKISSFEWFNHLVTNLQNVQIFNDSVFPRVRFQTLTVSQSGNRMADRKTCPLTPKTTKRSPNQIHAHSFQQTETDSNIEREKLRLKQHKYLSNMNRKIRHCN